MRVDDGLKWVPPGHMWLEGDNRELSVDSRTYGPVPIALCEGRVFAKVRFACSRLPYTDAACRYIRLQRPSGSAAARRKTANRSQRSMHLQSRAAALRQQEDDGSKKYGARDKQEGNKQTSKPATSERPTQGAPCRQASASRHTAAARPLFLAPCRATNM